MGRLPLDSLESFQSLSRQYCNAASDDRRTSVYKKIIAISLAAFLITACGGSSDDDSPDGTGTGTGTGTTAGGTPDGGTTGGGTPDGGATGGGATTEPVGGQSGTFGDSAIAGNATPGLFPVCPATITGSFSAFAEDGNGGFCVPGCPDGITVDNADGDEFGTFIEGGNMLTCAITAAAPGTAISIPFSAPINGCPEGGCPPGSFPTVLITANAGSELANTYECTPWLFNQVTQIWGQDTSPAPFALTLNTDFTAEIDGTPSTWSFTTGVLTIEGNMTFNNVAVGAGSFSSYLSNTALIRCQA